MATTLLREQPKAPTYRTDDYSIFDGLTYQDRVPYTVCRYDWSQPSREGSWAGDIAARQVRDFASRDATISVAVTIRGAVYLFAGSRIAMFDRRDGEISI